MILSLTNSIVDTLASAGGHSLHDLSAAADSAEQVSATLPLVLLGGVAAMGLALWAVGGRFVKPSVVLVASAAGGAAGFTLGESFDPAIGPWIGLACGVMVGIALGYWLYRMAAALLLGVFLAVAAPTAAAVALDYDLAAKAEAIVDVVRDAATGEHRDAVVESDEAETGLRTLAERSDDEPAGEDAHAAKRGVIERAGAWFTGFATDAAEGGQEIWEGMSVDEQRTIAAAGVIGAVAGFAIGGILPTLAMAMLTAGLGAAALLAAGSRLAVHFRPELEPSLPETPIAWAALWVSVAMLGVIVQLAPHRKRRKKKRESALESAEND